MSNIPYENPATGHKFIDSKLTFIKEIYKTVVGGKFKGKRVKHWLCKCDCGNEIAATPSQIVRAHVKPCGCQAKKHHKRCIFVK